MVSNATEVTDRDSSEKEKKWKGDQCCGLCRVDEDVDHIFFRCVVAQFTWSCFREALRRRGIPSTTMQDVLENWIPPLFFWVGGGGAIKGEFL